MLCDRGIFPQFVYAENANWCTLGAYKILQMLLRTSKLIRDKNTTRCESIGKELSRFFFQYLRQESFIHFRMPYITCRGNTNAPTSLENGAAMIIEGHTWNHICFCIFINIEFYLIRLWPTLHFSSNITIYGNMFNNWEKTSTNAAENSMFSFVELNGGSLRARII